MRLLRFQKYKNEDEQVVMVTQEKEYTPTKGRGISGDWGFLAKIVYTIHLQGVNVGPSFFDPSLTLTERMQAE